MNISQQLKSIGLNQSEITIYLFLLEHGLSTPPTVSRETTITRTNCYNILQALVEQGLVECRILKNKKTYLACDPNALFAIIQNKKRAIEQIMPDLYGLYNSHTNKPKIVFYDGIEEVKKLYITTLSASEIFCFGELLVIPSFSDHYMEDVRNKGILLHKLSIPPTQNEQYTSILIWDTTIAFISHQNTVFATTLTHHTLPHILKTIYQMLNKK